VNLEEYIASGILEAYALGDVTDAERAQVEEALQQYPALRAELQKAEDTLEAFATKASIPPRLQVRDRILASLPGPAQGKQVTFTTAQRLRPWKYAVAASLALALVASYLAYDYHARWMEKEMAFNELSSKNQQIAEDYNVVNQKLDKIQGDLGILENTAFKKVVMKGTANDVQALASVYWNESTKEVYISVQNLKAISRDHQFQLWAIVNGKPVDVGVFDSGFAGLLKMKNVSGAAAFAVTVEPRGGNQNPTLSTMQVIGALSREKS
jgi:anti-sigma-K factor RskA